MITPVTLAQPIDQLSVTNDSQTPVLIVGGGMVGLTLALMLAQQSIRVRLLEAATYPAQAPDQNGPAAYHPSFDGRNTALSRRTVQIYQQLGLWQALSQHATPILQVAISEQGGFGKASLKASEEQVESFGQVIENAWLGRVLLNAVRQQANWIELHDGVRITGLQQDSQTVTVRGQSAADSASLYQWQASLVIAADGRDSYCRQALGIGIDQHDYEQVALVATVKTSQPHAQQAFERFTPDGPLALLPLVGEVRRSVVWTVKAGTEQQWLGADNDTAFLAALQQAFGGRAGEFLQTGPRSSYPLAQIVAQSQVSGRVVLMGNAAHTLHPVAGQGFNLCIRDALVLTRMLALQQKNHQDLGETALLKRYESERQTDQQRVMRFCDSVVRGFSNHHPILKLARNTGLLAFDWIPGIKPLVATYAMGLKV